MRITIKAENSVCAIKHSIKHQKTKSEINLPWKSALESLNPLDPIIFAQIPPIHTPQIFCSKPTYSHPPIISLMSMKLLRCNFHSTALLHSSHAPLKNIVVIGSGLMGSGIVQVAAQAGYSLTMVDVKPDALEKGSPPSCAA